MKHENTHTEMQVSEQSRIVVGFVLVFNATSTIFQLYRDGQFYWRRKRSTRRKPPTCRKSMTNFIT